MKFLIGDPQGSMIIAVIQDKSQEGSATSSISLTINIHKDTERKRILQKTHPCDHKVGKNRGDQVSGAMDKARRLRTLSVLPEDQSADSGTHIRQLSTVCTS